MTDIIVIGAVPAGVLAALRSAAMCTRTALLTSGDFGGTAANDEPGPVRVLAGLLRTLDSQSTKIVLLRHCPERADFGLLIGYADACLKSAAMCG